MVNTNFPAHTNTKIWKYGAVRICINENSTQWYLMQPSPEIQKASTFLHWLFSN
jgi:hypothetical protein